MHNGEDSQTKIVQSEKAQTEKVQNRFTSDNRYSSINNKSKKKKNRDCKAKLQSY